MGIAAPRREQRQHCHCRHRRGRVLARIVRFQDGGQADRNGGDILTYQLTLANPSIPYVLPNVKVTNTLPSHTTYVPGSLSGSSGAWGYGDGIVTWTGALSPGASVTLTFKVTVDEVTGPLAIVNRAVLDDRVGVSRVIQAVTWIDPMACYDIPARCEVALTRTLFAGRRVRCAIALRGFQLGDRQIGDRDRTRYSGPFKHALGGIL